MDEKLIEAATTWLDEMEETFALTDDDRKLMRLAFEAGANASVAWDARAFVVSALRAAECEALTLAPRLAEPFRSNVVDVAAQCAHALKKMGVTRNASNSDADGRI